MYTLMYTLEGVSSVANFITAYAESQYNRDSHFLFVMCVPCFKRQFFLILFIAFICKVVIVSHLNICKSN